MRSSLIAITALAAVLAASACQRDHSDLFEQTADDAATPDETAAPTGAASPTEVAGDPAIAPGDAATPTMRYTCDEGHRVEIVETDTARVVLADGRSVELLRSAGSSPPMYSGEALQFAVGSEGGTLSQDEVGSFDCRAAG